MWKLHQPPNHDFVLNLSREFRKFDGLSPPQLPTFFGESILIASDYSSGRPDSSFFVISILIADSNYADKWDQLRREVRSSTLRDNRRMSYKGLNNSRQAIALDSFLESANDMPGLLVTFAVHKSMMNLFTVNDSLDQLESLFDFEARWKIKTLRKLTMAVGFVTFCCGGLLQDDQDTLWVTDDDDFTATDKRMRDCCQVLRYYHCMNMPTHVGKALFQKVSDLPNSQCDMQFEDLCSIPDLVAGTFSDCLSSMTKERELSFFDKPTEFNLGGVSDKSTTILTWHEDFNQRLRRILCVFVPVTEPGYAFRVVFPRSAEANDRAG